MSEQENIRRGRVIAVLGENIDTDIIYPGRFLNITDKLETAEHVFELVYPEIRKTMKPGDIIVAARNFGCGSSREQATAAIKFSGFGAVIACSFARIFYRNSLNLGLPLVISADAHKKLKAGDEIEIDLTAGKITQVASGEVIAAAPMSDQAAGLLKEGGLIPYLRKKHGVAKAGA
jgi:3-isopropylmalate/(R)-2-methylmalate dehydratase small subunit